MSLKPTDLLYVNREGTLYQVSWARIRERELLGTDLLLVQRGDTLYKVEIGEYWSGAKEIDELDFFMVERGDNGIFDPTDPGYKGELYHMQLSLPPFFAIDVISTAGPGEDPKVTFHYAAGAYNGDPEGARIQKPDGSFIYIGRGNQLFPANQDGVYRFSGDFTRFYMSGGENCIVDASLTPGETWNLLHANNAEFGKELFAGVTLGGVPRDLEVRSLEKTFKDTDVQNTVDVSTWDTSAATNAVACFQDSTVAALDLSGFDMSNVTDTTVMFQGANKFVGMGLDGWDCSNVTNMSRMFDRATKFNGNISAWTPTSVEDISYIFENARSFNATLAGWDMPALTNCEGAFSAAESFDSEVWPTLADGVTSLVSVFAGAKKFNQYIPWDIKNVSNLYATFQGAEQFDRDLSHWDTAKVSNFYRTFYMASGFDSNLDGWDTSAGTNFAEMFREARVFNSDIGVWETQLGRNMTSMFSDANIFNQDLSPWCVPLIDSKPANFDKNAAFQNDDGRQPEWGTCPDETEGRFYLTSGTLKLKAYKRLGGNKITLKYPDGTIYTESGSTLTKDLTDPGEYDINMSSLYRIEFKGSTNADFDFHPDFYVGTCTSLASAFSNCRVFNGDISNWDLSNCTDLNHTFYNATIFAGDLSKWDTSKVTNMTGIFGRALAVNDCQIENWITSNVSKMNYAFEFNPNFDVDISAWDVSNVTSAESLFKGATDVFNQDISGMNWEKNQAFRSMFKDCKKFNIDISPWDTATATSMDDMFRNASVFNQDISSWCVPLIGSKPSGFDTSSGFRNQTAIQPQWGTCPARPLTDPKIQSSDGSTIQVDPAGQAVKTDDATWDETATFVSQTWQGKVDATSAWQDIATGGGDTTAVPPQFADGFIRLVQEFDIGTAYSNELSVAPDSGLTTFAAFRFTSPTDPSDQIKIAGEIGSAGQIIYQDGTATSIGPGTFTKLFTAEGVYAITTTDLTKLNFTGTKFEVETDERSDLSALRDISGMFEETKGEQDMSWWDTSQVTNMARLFYNTHTIRTGRWDNNDVSNCTDTSEMFAGADQMKIDCSSWDTSKVTNMAGMFFLAAVSRNNFTADSINHFSTSNVTNMAFMLAATKYEGDLDSWDVANVEDMTSMFMANQGYNGPLGTWDVTGWTIEPEQMFYQASVFNQDISTWCVTNFDSEPFKFSRDCPLDSNFSYKPKWGTCPGDFPGSGTVTLTSGTLNINGDAIRSANVTGPNGYSETVDGEFNLVVTDPGDYELPMGDLIGLDFQDSEDAVFDFAPDFYTGNLTTLYACFRNCKLFNGDVANWDVSQVTNFARIFQFASAFNGDVSNWDVSNGIDLGIMFYDARLFNSDVSNWNVSNARSIGGTFQNCYEFNQDLSNWDVANVVDSSSIFAGCRKFNADISNWNTSNFSCGSYMFDRASIFNVDISGWDTSNCTVMRVMFNGANLFNIDISGWDVANVSCMTWMFSGASKFNQDISSWCVPLIGSKPENFDSGSGFANQTELQPQWGTCPPKTVQEPVIANSTTPGLTADYGDVLEITQNGETNPDITPTSQWQRETAVDSDTFEDIAGETGTTYTVVAADQGKNIRVKQTFSDADGTNVMRSNQITVTNVPPPEPNFFGFSFTTGEATIKVTQPADAEVYKEDGGSWTKVGDLTTGTSTFTASTPGLYIFDATDMTTFSFDGTTDDCDLLIDERSYMEKVTSLYQAFIRCKAFNQDLSWMDVSNVTNLSKCFQACSVFNGNISGWNVSKVTNLGNIFTGCGQFNMSLNSWDVSNVTYLKEAFSNSAYNGNISSWDTSNVVNMVGIFSSAKSFNQDISGWNTSKVTSLNSAFSYATQFNQYIGGWDTSNCTGLYKTFFSAYRFNQDLSGWNTSKVTTMGGTFWGCSYFNGNIGGWDTSKVTAMDKMFSSNFGINSDISGWDVANVVNMTQMFYNSHDFDQDISTWCVSNIGTKPDMFDQDANRNFENHPERQPQWGTCPPRITSNPVIY